MRIRLGAPQGTRSSGPLVRPQTAVQARLWYAVAYGNPSLMFQVNIE